MGRKRNPYLPLYTRDIASSPRCRALTPLAAGIYLFLLCRLNEPPTPGAFRLSDWEAHPNWRRSLTQQCLANPDKQARLQYFARYLAKNDLPWERREVLEGLQELYRLRIIVVEGDMLVQPRMYKDNGFSLADLDNDGQPADTILDDKASGSMAVREGDVFEENNGAEKGTKKRTKNSPKKVQKKSQKSRARASRALSVENMSNNNKGGKGGKKDDVGGMKGDGRGVKDDSKKPAKRTLKRRAVADNPPTIEDITAYFREREAQGKPFRYITPEGFYDACVQSGWCLKDGKPMIDWQARLRTFENFRKEHGDRPVASRGAPKSQAVPQREGKEYEDWD